MDCHASVTRKLGFLNHTNEFTCPQSFQLQQTTGIALVDGVALLRRDVKGVNDIYRPARISRPLLRIEWRIRGKQHPVGTKKVKPQCGRLSRAKHRRVSVEHLEVVKWAFFKPLQNQ